MTMTICFFMALLWFCLTKKVLLKLFFVLQIDFTSFHHQKTMKSKRKCEKQEKFKRKTWEKRDKHEKIRERQKKTLGKEKNMRKTREIREKQ